MHLGFAKCVSTCFGVGFLPMPGTCASALTCAGIWFFGSVSVAATVLVAVFGWICLKQYLRNFLDVHVDPPCVVIDEVVGQMIALIGVPINVVSLGAGFVAFRFFDILKPGPIGKVEKLPGAYGVMLDDVLAGLSALVCVGGMEGLWNRLM